MKKYKIAFWVSTTIIFLMEGVLPALTFNSEMAVQGITGLGYPIYFGTMLAFFKVLGSLSLIIPKISARIKEWAYAGFGIDFIAASWSIWAVKGFSFAVVFPMIFMAILVVSYISYHKIKNV